ncbi:tryptophan halogenase family protein [Pseudidiomarina insulisalsae]|uniref:Tryptophan halogenase n=1 Tax=Pseudidiomarina insulisalsae TaxID=575789 RepID=A0A432YPN1_9GAMM|nr:tryptophan halogenase family protein [Pseudidiomarina insulisalsae]RUO63076.1 tryptophan halogenase [Pseudidiomarina insulisalsae]
MTQPYHIVILGGGSAGWMTAAALAKVLDQKHYKLTLVESSAIGTVSVGEATIPGIREFNQLLQIDEDEFLRETQGSFKLGIAFENWQNIGDAYMHPFGPYGVTLNGVPFHHYYLRHEREQGQGAAMPLHELNLEWSMANGNKFSRPIADKRSPLGHIKYAYHFDAHAYARYLKKYATQRGVVALEDRMLEAKQAQKHGALQALILEQHGELQADFFIDCSGFKALLIGEALGVEYHDWRKWMPCDSAVALPGQHDADTILPYTRSIAHHEGWRWKIPLQHRTGEGWVYSSRFTDSDKAEREFRETIGNFDSKANHLRWMNGRRDEAWKHNVCAIGLSAGFIEPLESTGLQLTQSGIMRLISLLPGAGSMTERAHAFNRYTAEEITNIRDFVMCHYKLTARDDSAFWRYCRDMAIPDSLQERLELYRENASIFRNSNNELFNEISWFSMFHGQGLTPKNVHPLAEQMPAANLQQHLKTIQGIFKQSVAQLPSHAAFIRKHCQA